MKVKDVSVSHKDKPRSDPWKHKGLPAVARAVAEIEEAKAHTKTDYQYEVLEKALDLLTEL